MAEIIGILTTIVTGAELAVKIGEVCIIHRSCAVELWLTDPRIGRQQGYPRNPKGPQEKVSLDPVHGQE
jgi:hypothetical protein